MNIGDIKEVKIEHLVYGGDGLGHIDGQVVFVPFAAPGDRLRVQISSLNHDYIRAEIVDIIENSCSRISPPCPAFGECGGCQWQHLRYTQQLLSKMDLVRQALVREGKVYDFQLRPVIASPQEFHYRHRMQFGVNHHDRQPHLGLYKRKTHDLIEIKECSLAHPLINSFLDNMREVFSQHDNRLVQGIDVTVDGDGKSLLPVFHFRRGDMEDQRQWFSNLQRAMPEVAGALLRIEEYKKAQAIQIGQQQIIYPTCGYKLFIGPETFIQVNKEGNKILVQVVLDQISRIADSERVKILELHCGAGNFTLPLSRMATEVAGIESCPGSVELARKSIWMQDIINCQIYSKSDLKGIKYLLKNHRSFDLLVMDPPRCGCKEILEYIPQLGVRHIVYVSCNLSTLARDIGILLQLGYRLDVIQPIDMFPQTHHVECVAKLEKIHE